MKIKTLILTGALLLCISGICTAQEDSLAVAPKRALDSPVLNEDSEPYNPLAPAKAAFFSAILPGLGQAYNGQYWKIPIAYAGLGIGVYFYIDNDEKYNRYRDAYKSRLAGREDDEFFGSISTSRLIDAQELFQRNKEISILVTVGIYILNIVDANVTAHLQQFNVNEDLSLKPKMNYDVLTGKPNYGLSLNFNF
ncbi:DUF5683 domain-containing protein [Zunongwangia sp. F363]|uniref:DUF5683 domain-containing protein n=1 Tax=Autumnicola tepida TaxID=3075595 RepID=A0ABU3C956_9FLAO|nr:DUF5683 domain-containing protein [Zunongwangia sp. F363]MDT0642857.1 DUF5683 domain-containing protein [Zunongwangia sp. F363]